MEYLLNKISLPHQGTYFSCKGLVTLIIIIYYQKRQNVRTAPIILSIYWLVYCRPLLVCTWTCQNGFRCCQRDYWIQLQLIDRRNMWLDLQMDIQSLVYIRICIHHLQTLFPKLEHTEKFRAVNKKLVFCSQKLINS